MLDFKGLKLGVATASAQIEGGEVDSNWNRYSNQGKITDGSNIKRATDHYNRYEEDIALLESLSIKHYRMSVEWARIEPTNGNFSMEAIQHYRDEIMKMQAKGISVLLTLHHFSEPGWFCDLGSFEKVENISYFIRFATFVVEHLGDLVQDFCTINEPNVYAVNAYLFGEWLQEEKNFFKTLRVLNVLAAAHIAAYNKIHSIFTDKNWGQVNVCFALNMRYFTPNSHSLIDKIGAKALNFLYQKGLFLAFAKGEFVFPFRNLCKHPKGKYIDKIGVNYYSRGMVKGFTDFVKENAPKNDLGWEIYPDGFVPCLQMVHSIMPLEIMITENGCCDNNDAFRPKFMYEHLKALVESSLPITHYYHWCFVDNFEWKEGELPRFGIVHVDYETQKRTIKKSGWMYKELIENNGFTQQIFDTYVKDITYHGTDVNILQPYYNNDEWKNRR